MGTTGKANDSSASTTWAWRRVKVLSGAAPPAARSPEASARRRLKRWDRYDPLTMQVVYRGGAEAWWEIKARGCVWRFPGTLCIEDVFARIMKDQR